MTLRSSAPVFVPQAPSSRAPPPGLLVARPPGLPPPAGRRQGAGLDEGLPSGRAEACFATPGHGLPSAGLFCPYCVGREACAFHPPWRPAPAPLPARRVEELVWEVLRAGMAADDEEEGSSQPRRRALPPPPAMLPPPPPSLAPPRKVDSADRSGRPPAAAPASRPVEEASTADPGSAAASQCDEDRASEEEGSGALDRRVAWRAPSWAEVAKPRSLAHTGLAATSPPEGRGRWRRRTFERAPTILQRGIAHGPR